MNRRFQKTSWRSHWQPFPYPTKADRKVRCTCGDAAHLGQFCRRCLARVPDELQRELNFCERMMKDSDRWTVAVAQVEQFLRSNPSPRG